ncbi:hypothetical protein H7691_06595 [Stenotrophomonas sp. CW117]|uniref:hypothetical protein n=1 Tax=Stenotrophomonas TaxID=40323 RepID=UPI001782204F|nr:hypothetical protein [Stenotrophomonas sp. CW117]QOF99778.1 hypothetical protein H7691_06595 [Stenotrophomonas sp. CW117]
MDKRAIAAAILATATVTGCMNLATKPAEITGSYTSDLKYQNYNCDQLGIEVNSLARRENQLATAQEQRRKSGKVQAFWLGYGTGDGIEAAELANVRGEKEAVRRAMDKQSCGTPAASYAPSASPSPAAATQPAASAPEAGSNWRSWGAPANAPAQSKVLYRCPAANGGQVVTETPAAGCTVISP